MTEVAVYRYEGKQRTEVLRAHLVDGRVFVSGKQGIVKLCMDGFADMSGIGGVIGRRVTPADGELFLKVLALQFNGSYLRSEVIDHVRPPKNREEIKP